MKNSFACLGSSEAVIAGTLPKEWMVVQQLALGRLGARFEGFGLQEVSLVVEQVSGMVLLTQRVRREHQAQVAKELGCLVRAGSVCEVVE